MGKRADKEKNRARFSFDVKVCMSLSLLTIDAAKREKKRTRVTPKSAPEGMLAASRGESSSRKRGGEKREEGGGKSGGKAGALAQ